MYFVNFRERFVEMNGITRENSNLKSFMKVKSRGEVPLRQRFNWLIHAQLVRQDADDCNTLIEQDLKNSNGKCEYAIYARGMLLRQEGKILDSLQCFKTCQSMNPKNPQYIKQQAYSLSLLGRTQEAIDKYAEADEMSRRGDWEIAYRLGQCYFQNNDYEKARIYFENALKLNRGNDDVSHSLAQTCINLGKKKAAINVYEEAIKYSSNNGHLAVNLTYLWVLDGGDRDVRQPMDKLNTALSHHPQSFPLLLATGAMTQDQRQLEIALAKYHAAVKINPFSVALWNNIGLCFLGKKKYLAAIGCLKRAAYLNPLSVEVAHNLGLINLLMSQFASAAMYLSQALSIARKSNKTAFSSIFNGSKHKKSWIIGQGYILLAAALKNLGDMKNAKSAHQMALNTEHDDPLPPLSYALFLWETERKQTPDNPDGENKCYEVIFKMLDEFEKRVKREGREVAPGMLEAANQLKTALKILEDHKKSEK
ncbi:Bardet-Biedl syndrome 4 protein homolog isoform X2 [Ischnura elegans]|uniref:Bardet-Biedl syndrome 4 protein homolog isoform X2 n=1 Tax=Ischnura elegans TaxID=197161 RepID=UPI001ED867E5|nr:Bardet-Biedl syndrome 4 protein homolog isoform X2 [Ischnura elegans]